MAGITTRAPNNVQICIIRRCQFKLVQLSVVSKLYMKSQTGGRWCDSRMLTCPMFGCHAENCELMLSMWRAAPVLGSVEFSLLYSAKDCTLQCVIHRAKVHYFDHSFTHLTDRRRRFAVESIAREPFITTILSSSSPLFLLRPLQEECARITIVHC